MKYKLISEDGGALSGNYDFGFFLLMPKKKISYPTLALCTRLFHSSNLALLYVQYVRIGVPAVSRDAGGRSAPSAGRVRRGQGPDIHGRPAVQVSQVHWHSLQYVQEVLFYVESYYIKWVNTSVTYSVSS